MLTQAELLGAFGQLSEELGRRGIFGELCVVDGTAMMLAFNARTSTKDVDAIFEPTSEVRAAAKAVATKLSLLDDWLSDAAKGFLSPSGDFTPVETIDLPNLRVQAPTPEYTLAMKVLASRTSTDAQRGDPHDIAHLIRLLGLKSSDEVMRIVTRYYDPSRVLPRSIYLVDQILDELK